jgi:hypothetical protein
MGLHQREINLDESRSSEVPIFALNGRMRTLNAAFQGKSHQDKLSTATLASRACASSAQIQTPALPDEVVRRRPDRRRS